MIDSVLAHVDAARAPEPWAALGVEPGGYALVTLHRPALVDDPVLLARDRRRARRSSPATLPGRLPRPPAHARSTCGELGLEPGSPRRACSSARRSATSPSSGSQAEARFVLTDSGGVQEETSALGVRCFTLRDTTERPVTVELGTNTVLGAKPERIAEIPTLLEQKRRRARSRSGTAPLVDVRPPSCVTSSAATGWRRPVSPTSRVRPNDRFVRSSKTRCGGRPDELSLPARRRAEPRPQRLILE